MASGKSKTIEEIDDIVEMAGVLKTLGIWSKGLTTLQQMKERVKDELHQSEKKPSWTAGQPGIINTQY